MGKMWTRAKRPNAPPSDAPWTWRTREMLASEAWKALPLAARRVLDRIEIEHMNHAGTMNGRLIVTTEQFTAHGIARGHVSHAVACVEALGFIAVQHGRRSYGGVRQPNLYAITHLPTCDGAPPTNAWKLIKTAADAQRALERASGKTGTVNQKQSRGVHAPSKRGRPATALPTGAPAAPSSDVHSRGNIKSLPVYGHGDRDGETSHFEGIGSVVARLLPVNGHGACPETGTGKKRAQA